MRRSIVGPVCASFAIAASMGCSPFNSGDATANTDADAGPVWTTGPGSPDAGPPSGGGDAGQ
ncbi:MAG TPA: hypothetical protein VG496_10815, partial [Myxococcales bacterium]|nr:hypothetical protein [Myxococcales bacterium]